MDNDLLFEIDLDLILTPQNRWLKRAVEDDIKYLLRRGAVGTEGGWERLYDMIGGPLLVRSGLARVRGRDRNEDGEPDDRYHTYLHYRLVDATVAREILEKYGRRKVNIS
jgi:hypothetical protein